jgi:hypothetical protein
MVSSRNIRPIVCAYCERTHAVNRDGRVRRHPSPASSRSCLGSHTMADGHALAPVNSAPGKRPCSTE